MPLPVRLFSTLLLILLAASASAQLPPRAQIDAELAGIYATRQAAPLTGRQGDLSRRLEAVIRKQARYLSGLLKPWSEDPRARLLTDGNHGEHGIRPNTHTAFGLAVLARGLGDGPEGPSAAEARDRAIAILRFVLPTHGDGGRLCSDGKPWRGQWQSALWASQAGKAAWLLWDDLDPELRWLAARMICEEADRFVDREPDHNVTIDTKAEENAWNATVVALAYNMFPGHSRHAVWGETAIRWQVSAFVTAGDIAANPVVDGRPLDQWVRYPNLHEDYTLENHHRVHPDYMTAMNLNRDQAEVYAWGGNPATEALRFNAEKIYANLKKLSQPDGGLIYPSGQDWQIHRNADWVHCHVAMTVLSHDPQGATLARLSLETAERMLARDPQGGVYAPGETTFPSSQGQVFEGFAASWLLMAREGEGPAPVPEEELWRALAGRWLFPYGQFAVMRTATSVATFSWGRQVMGQVYPLRRDLLCTPNERGLIGIVEAEGVEREAPVVKEARLLETPPGVLAVTGVLERGGGALEQRFAFVSLDDGHTIYVDVPRVTGQGTLTQARLGLVAVLNDRDWVWHDGQRRLVDAGGEHVFAAAEAKTGAPYEAAARWFNLDGLGILLPAGGRQRYDPRPTGASCRLEQLFVLNQADSPQALQPTVIVFCPGQTPEETRQAAAALKLTQPAADRFTIDLHGGPQVVIDLQTLSAGVQ